MDTSKKIDQLKLLDASWYTRHFGAQAAEVGEIPTSTPLMIELFEQQAALHPTEVAVVFEQESLSYQQLNIQANQLAYRLQAQTLNAGSRIGICLEPSLQLPVALLAILKIGASYLPIDPASPLRHLDFLYDLNHMDCLLLDAATRPLFGTEEQVRIMVLEALQAEVVITEEANANPPRTIRATDLVCIQYDLAQKGVCFSNASLLAYFDYLNTLNKEQENAETWLAWHALDTEASLLELLWNWSRGKKVVLAPAPRVPLNGTQAIDCSLFYFAAQEEITHENKYRLLLEGAKFADENDFAAIWVPERHFHSFGDQFPNPSVAAAAVAVTTQKIKLRSGSVVLPLHDPIRVAEEWSMVDHLSEGRVEISFASGWNPNDFVFAPEAYENRHQEMCKKIDLVHRLWQGETCTRTNGKGEEISLSIHPKPVQDKLPTWITSGGSPETFRYAGSIGANILTLLWGQAKEDLKGKIEIYRTALAKHGFDPAQGKVAVMLHSFIGEEFSEVQPTVKEPLKNYIRHSIALMQGKSNQGVDEEVEKLVEASFTHHYHTNGLFGTPETCLAYLQELSLLGVTEIACLIDFGISNDLTLANLPQLKKLESLIKRSAAQQNLLAQRLTNKLTIAALIDRHQVTHLYAAGNTLDTWQYVANTLPSLLNLQQVLLSTAGLTDFASAWLTAHTEKLPADWQKENNEKASKEACCYRQGRKIDLNLLAHYLQRHVQIETASVVVRQRGDAPILVAYVVSSEKLSTQQLRFFLSYHLPHYYLPDLFIPTERHQAPIQSDGNLMEKALPLGTTYLAPRNDTELALAKIWGKVLQKNSEKIGIDDSFFALGANEQSVFSLCEALQATMEWQMEPLAIYHHDTIRTLSILYLNEMANKKVVVEEEDTVDLFENNLNLFNEA